MINYNVHHLGERMQKEFEYIQKYLNGEGVDVGYGTNTV